MKKEDHEDYYISQKKSAAEIAIEYNFSVSKINYWIAKHNIPKRTISEGVYQKKNPRGNPFEFKEPQNISDMFLFGLGLGLFWGEGNKRNRHSVRLGNTDPKLVKVFIKFLREIFKVEEEKFRFGIQVFNDCNPKESLNYWSNELGFSKDHFLPTIVVSNVRGVGNYKNKSKHGVLTIYVNNKKLKDHISEMIENVGKIG